jgi:hypothetical protein
MNKYNLPIPLERALTPERKQPVLGRYSVTALIDSPYRRILGMIHHNEVDEDVSGGLWALMGKAAHYVIEQSGSGGQEVKIEVPFEDITIVGVVDHYENGHIIDWKMTSAWSFLHGVKPEWELQLNLYAYLIAPLPVNKLSIYAILRDWSKTDYRKSPETYPPIPFQEVTVDLWEGDKLLTYIKTRVDLHKQAEGLLNAPDSIDYCSDVERWTRPSTFSVAKKEFDRAKRVLPTEEEAIKYIDDNKLTGYSVWLRKGVDARCQDYCQFTKWCRYIRENVNMLPTNIEELAF